MTNPPTIQPLPLPASTTPGAASLDYNALRQMGLDAIIALGSSFWTDFNIHDPGITILEALCYALTDGAYRADFPVEVLIAPPPGVAADTDRQGFFTARNILSVNPWTVLDFRKLLLDVSGVKNAWVIPKQCPCPSELRLFADCKTSSLTYTKSDYPVIVKGLYDVLLEFADQDAGDLNSGKITQTVVFPGSQASAAIEMRFPSWHQVGQNPAFQNFRRFGAQVTGVTVNYISGNDTDTVDIAADALTAALNGPLYAGLQITFTPDPGGAGLALSHVPFRVWFNSPADRQTVQLSQIRAALQSTPGSGLAARYALLLSQADAVVAAAGASLEAHRNLGEDFCSIDAVEAADIGICLDLLLQPGADIEEVVAQAYYQVGEYFAPSVQFYSLSDRRAAGLTIDQIFDGPALASGFVDDAQLASTDLKQTLYASDVMRILSEIEGVVAVENFVFVHYTSEGVRDAVYPWSIDIPARQEARLYQAGSKILVYINGLPMLPDPELVADALQRIQGENEPSALNSEDNDLPVPSGAYSNLADYYPVQYSLPETYGVSETGLSAMTPVKRQAQARQLRAYLYFYEQFLLNYLTQLQNAWQLFAIDPAVKRTYFTQLIDATLIRDLNLVLNPSLTPPVLDGLAETSAEELDRRNRFLDHLLARFAEDFSGYALMLYSYQQSQAIAQAELIQNKIAFLQDYPSASANRGKSFDYKLPNLVCSDQNVAGLRQRIQLLLGLAPTEEIYIIEHVLLRPRNGPGSAAAPTGDPLLPICVPRDCTHCAAEADPYSFWLTVVLRGDVGAAGYNLPFRGFAEQTIRLETPAHLALKICWVSAQQLAPLRAAYCAWLAELAKPQPDAAQQSSLLGALIKVLITLKSVYPPATLADCTNSQGNEVFLNQTVV